MIDVWTQFVVAWELIGELHEWLTPGEHYNAHTGYTHDYCDECGERGCIETACQASRRGYFGDLVDYITKWRDPYGHRVST